VEVAASARLAALRVRRAAAAEQGPVQSRAELLDSDSQAQRALQGRRAQQAPKELQAL
jgi:hypothetical protein